MASNGYSFKGQPKNNGILRNEQNENDTYYNKNTTRKVFSNALFGNGQSPVTEYNYTPQRIKNSVNGSAKNIAVRSPAGYDGYQNQSFFDNTTYSAIDESEANIVTGFTSDLSATSTSGSYYGDTDSLEDQSRGFPASAVDNNIFGYNKYSEQNSVIPGFNSEGNYVAADTNPDVDAINSTRNFYQTFDPNAQPDQVEDKVAQTLDEFGNPTNVFGQSLSELLTKPERYDEFTQANDKDGEQEYANLREVVSAAILVDVSTSCDCSDCSGMSNNLEFLRAVLIPKHEYALSFILTAVVLILYCLVSWFYAIFMQYWSPQQKCLSWFS